MHSVHIKIPIGIIEINKDTFVLIGKYLSIIVSNSFSITVDYNVLMKI
jgi:hypothetical protein